MPLLSVIIPVFNRKNTISYCIDSILQQTFGDFELLIIDDGSSDGTKEICLFYASLDSRISYYYQNNQGISSARNAGIQRAVGEYITFIDSDDIVENLGLELLTTHIKDGYDMLIAGYKTGRVTSCSPLVYSISSRHEFLSIELNGVDNIFHYFFSSFNHEKSYLFFPWGKIYRRSILQNIRFHTDISLGEDRIFVLECFLHIQKLKVIPDSGYIALNISSTGGVQASTKKRTPEEFFHCFVMNYLILFGLSKKMRLQSIKDYADSYFYTKILEYIIIPNKANYAPINYYYLSQIKPFIKEYKIDWKKIQNNTFQKFAFALDFLGVRTFCLLLEIRAFVLGK